MPVIYTKGQGFDGQYKDGEVGYAVKACDYKNLSEAILKCYESYSSISKTAFEKCSNYDWAIINKKIVDLYIKCTRR